MSFCRLDGQVKIAEEAKRIECELKDRKRGKNKIYLKPSSFV